MKNSLSKASASAVALDMIDYQPIFMYAPQQKIAVIRNGLAAKELGALANSMNVAKDFLTAMLGISRATLGRKERAGGTLSLEESERLLGVQSLIGQVQRMVVESGEPAGFDAAKWLADWINLPLPALAGETPASYMDTIEGQKLISNLLATAQSGAYA